ncbi:Cys-tRNA(Pro) deacylase [Veillonella rodentium]|uniref:Cys-tRNA(Pro)/Cys-tRNA(Cys) deacylase n=1 Tax=Veillonella rodentium TaxID=248315 RepID=A0A239YTC9_9FIRM|nr:Cys-tRNA(Pro) deacylase [Veillonella rodentium]SNV61494.1 Cys-tRNA(Pro)/Cys-tRNA(Cys) deacylase ybaK [Veillonella rodentium]
MSKEKHKKTNALRILDTHKVPYNISEYEWSEGRAAGLHVAEVLGLDEKKVFKTLVGKGDKTGYVVFCIPVAAELDMKQAARVSHNKSVELIHVKDLLGITGYWRGGCSPVGMKKSFPTYFDATMEMQDSVYVSAGLRGMQMQVNPVELAAVVNAEFAALTMNH